MPENRPFDPVFQTTLPLPLARLYTRAHHAKGDRERHDHAFHLLEAALKLAAAALVARYRSHGERSPKVDAALRHLARPSLGQWRTLLREILTFLAEGVKPDSWAGKIIEKVGKGSEALGEAFSQIAKSAQYKGRAIARPAALDLLDLLPTYRNVMSDAHGGIKADPEAYREPTPALLAIAHTLLEDGAILGGGRLVYSEEVRVGLQGEGRVVWMDLTGMAAMRRQPFEGEATSEEILPGRLYLEIPGDAHLPLYPLLHYHPGEIIDEVFFLNRAREGAGGVQFLSYSTGEFYMPGRDPVGDTLLKELKELLSWVTQSDVVPSRMDELVTASRTEAQRSGEVIEEAPTPSGTVLGDFEILGELGRGAMAVVYLARQMSLNRQVALKVLPPGLGHDPVALSRFKQEVKALSRCDHPNVVKILSSGEAQGTHFYAMELIDGGDLGVIEKTLERYRSSGMDVLCEEDFDRAASSASSRPEGDRSIGLPEAGKLTLRPIEGLHEGRNIAFRLAAVIRDAARGVHHVHEHGIVHRDLKPQNIMVTRSEHRPVVMDLGLAKLSDVTKSLTLDKASILGTLRYMPPEQLQRNLLEVDARADVYALGAVLYELACLRPMLDGDTEERLTTQILFEEPPPAQKVNPRLPTDLATIIAKATRKDPKERYASAAEIADDLDCFVHGEAIAAKALTLGYLLRLFMKRHRAAMIVAASVTMFFALALAFWILLLQAAWKSEQQAREEAQEHARSAQKQTALAQDRLAEANESLSNLFLEKAQRSLAEGAAQRAVVYAAASMEKKESFAAREVLYHARLRNMEGPIWASPRGMGWLRTVAFSRDGRKLAAGSEDRVIRIWDTETGMEIADLEGHTGWVNTVVFSPDGKRLASASDDGTLRLWDSGTGREVRFFTGHGAEVWCVAFTRDGSRLVSGSRDKTVRLWNVESGEELARLEGHTEEVRSVAISPDGKLLASGSFDRSVILWDLETLKKLTLLEGHTAGVNSVAFSADGPKLASGSLDGTIILWSVPERKELTRWTGHRDWVLSVAFSPDGKLLASGSRDHSVKLWPLEEAGTRGEAKDLLDHSGMVESVAFSPDGLKVASSSSDGEVRLWDVSTGRPLAKAGAGHTGGIRAVAFSPDGRWIASGSDDKTIRLWDRNDGKELARFEGHTKDVRCIVCSHDSKRIISGSLDQTICIWDVDTGKEDGRLKGHTEAVFAVALSPDGKLLASGSRDKTIRLWNLLTRAESGPPLEGHTDTVRCLTFSQDGRQLISGSYDRTIRIWDVETRRQARLLSGHKGAVYSVQVSPDGTRLGSCSEDMTIRLWNLATGEEALRLEGHKAFVGEITFSADGSRLASGSGDTTIRLWDVMSGAEVSQLEGHSDAVFSLIFSPDGKNLASGSYDSTVKLWSLEEPVDRGLLKEHRGHVRTVSSLAFSPDGRSLATGSDGPIRICSLVTGDEMARLEGHKEAVYSVAFCPTHGSKLASGGEDKTVRLWDVATKQMTILDIFGHTDRVWCVAFSPDGTRLASGSKDKTIRLWDVETERMVKLLEGPKGDVHFVSFSPDGQLLASSSFDDKIRIWDTEQGKVLREWQRIHLSRIAFSPDGKRLAYTTFDGLVALLDVGTGETIAQLKGHAASVNSVAFSPDGRFLASGSWDNTLRLWDLSTFTEVMRLGAHTEAVECVAFSPGGHRLASGSYDRTFRLWDVGLLLQIAREPTHTFKQQTGLILDGTEVKPAPDRLPHNFIWLSGPSAQKSRR